MGNKNDSARESKVIIPDVYPDYNHIDHHLPEDDDPLNDGNPPGGQHLTQLLVDKLTGDVFVNSSTDDNSSDLITLKQNTYYDPIRISDLSDPYMADMYMDWTYLYDGQAAIAAVDLRGKEQFHDLDKLTSGYFLLTSYDLSLIHI